MKNYTKKITGFTIINSIILIAGLAILSFISFSFFWTPNNNIDKINIDNTKDLSNLNTTYEWWLKKITMATSTTQDWQILMWIAEKINVFEKNWLDVDILNVFKWTDALLMANQVDVKLWWTPNAVWIYLNDQDIRLIATLWRNSIYNIYSRFPIWELSKIKKIAISKTWVEPHYKFLWTLKSLWVDTTNLESVIIPDENTRYQMLLKWEVDATNIMLHWIVAKDSWLYALVWDDKKVEGYNFPKAILTNQYVIDNKPEELRKFVNAIFETVDYMKKNKEETKIVMKEKYPEFTEEDLDDIYDSFLKTLDWETFIPDTSSFESDRWLVQEIGLPVNPTRDLKDFVYTKFAEDALANFPIK